MIDVLIISYNHAKYLELAVASVLAQDCQDKINRIMICDDASTDDSAALIEKLAAQSPDKIIPILREENVGLARNLRLGLGYCFAPYVAILEGDDVWCSRGKLSVQKAGLDNYPNLAAIAHDVVEMDHKAISPADFDRTPLKGDENLVRLNDHALLLHNHYGFFPSTLMARTAILKQCVLPEFDDLKTLDCAVHWMLGQKGELGFFNVPMAVHGGHSDSAFSQANNLLGVYLIQVILRILPHLNPDYAAIAKVWLRYYTEGWVEHLPIPSRLPEIQLSYHYITECGDPVLSDYFFGAHGIVTQHEQNLVEAPDRETDEATAQDLYFKAARVKF
ncbi:MAG: glycosyltransferase [Candidatus Symbiobacter sp.]|nr:glycosyltransferase [Candidatus Symbiobacter sp.]